MTDAEQQPGNIEQALPGSGSLLSRVPVQAFVWAAVTLTAAILELQRWLDPEQRQRALGGRIFEGAEDFGPFLPILLAAPLIYWGAARARRAPSSLAEEAPNRPAGSGIIALLASLAVGTLAFAASATFGKPFEGMPPVFHDEYSYLLQAQTFLLGRTWTPSHPVMPELFDQVHVLNEGRFASRYFPGTGAWIAPFLALGHPHAGHWLANGLLAAGMVWIGRLLSGLKVGIGAGLLCALSPGLITFSNLLLAHHPTLVGLTLFLWAILRCRERPSAAAALLAGIGLSFAMLCRPMTAAGVALPFGIDWLVRLCRRPEFEARASARAPRPTWRQTLALGLPLFVGVLIMLGYNHSITGRFLRSPYQEYTDLYTPRHVYGFNNVVRGEQQLGPKVLDNYDRWAENLTPALALRNVEVRTITSLRGTLGVIPLLLAAVALLLDWRRLSTSWKLVMASILSLHAAHIPYWFDGIMGWHYVFESAPLWLLLFSEATRRLFNTWDAWGARRLRWWWLSLVALALLVNLRTVEPLWRSRLAFAQSEAAFARVRYVKFRHMAAHLAERGPVIVFVEHDPSDRHMDYISNPPTLDGPVLVARLQPETDLARAIALFPTRHPYRFRPAADQWDDLVPRSNTNPAE